MDVTPTFLPQTSEHELPAVQLGDVLVFVYMKDGTLCVTVDTEGLTGEAPPIKIRLNDRTLLVTPTPETTTYVQGERVHAKNWADTVFLVKGYTTHPVKGELVEIVTPDGAASGAVPSSELRRI